MPADMEDPFGDLSDGAFLELRPDINDVPPTTYSASIEEPEVIVPAKQARRRRTQAALVMNGEADYADVSTDSAVAVYTPPTGQHLVAGLGTLGQMSDEEFEAKAKEMRRGIDRIRKLQETLLDKGIDYGEVKGIKRPFLQKAGAEKLALFGGYAVSFRIQRDVSTEPGIPPLSYVAYCKVHLVSTDGPVVAEGVGEANSYEEHYRYRWQDPTCTSCGKNVLIKGKADGKLAGKWWCAPWKGGCNAVYAPEEISPSTRVENDDPWDLANTLVKMAKKRALVDGILTATGTSGLFTQDLDSPSVQRDAAPEENETAVVVGAPSTEAAVGRGGTVTGITSTQVMAISKLSVEHKLGKAGMVSLIHRVLGATVAESGLSAYINGLSGENAGALLRALETGEVPSMSEMSDELAEALIDPDIGAK